MMFFVPNKQMDLKCEIGQLWKSDQNFIMHALMSQSKDLHLKNPVKFLMLIRSYECILKAFMIYILRCFFLVLVQVSIRHQGPLRMLILIAVSFSLIKYHLQTALAKIIWNAALIAPRRVGAFKDLVAGLCFKYYHSLTLLVFASSNKLEIEIRYLNVFWYKLKNIELRK